MLEDQLVIFQYLNLVGLAKAPMREPLEGLTISFLQRELIALILLLLKVDLLAFGVPFNQV